MARRNKGPEEEGGNWMDTYGDMVTLILTFFVLLYSMSTMDKAKWQMIAQAFSSMGQVINTVVAGETEVEDPSGNLIEDAQLNAGEVPENFDQLYQYLQNYVTEQGISESVSVEKGATNVYLKFRDNIFFAANSPVLLDEGKQVLSDISAGIAAVESQILGIKINGYTAEAAASKVDEWDLSSGRSNAVLKYLRSLEICPIEKMSSSGFGKYRPVAENETEEGRRQNRRVEIIIARNDADYSDPQVIKELLEMEFGAGFVQESMDDGSLPIEDSTTPPTEDDPTVTGEESGTAEPPGDSSGRPAESDGESTDNTSQDSTQPKDVTDGGKTVNITR